MSRRLLDAELRRFFSRRLVLGSLLASLLLLVVINAVQIARSSDPGVHMSEAFLGNPPTECRVGTFDGAPVLDRGCTMQRGEFRVPDSSQATIDALPPGTRVERVYYNLARDRRIRIASTLSRTLRIIGGFMVFGSIVLAASFLAADFGTSIGTQLMFEPRRTLVYLTKTLAVMLGCAACAACIALAATLLQYLGAATRGFTAGIDAHWLGLRLADLGRIMAVSALAAPLGLAIAALTKRTAAAVGIFFGMMIGYGFLHNTSWGRPIAKVLPVNGLFSAAINQFGRDGGTNGADFTTLWGALLLCIVWAVALTLITTAWFNQREIR